MCHLMHSGIVRLQGLEREGLPQDLSSIRAGLLGEYLEYLEEDVVRCHGHDIPQVAMLPDLPLQREALASKSEKAGRPTPNV